MALSGRSFNIFFDFGRVSKSIKKSINKNLFKNRFFSEPGLKANFHRFGLDFWSVFCLFFGAQKDMFLEPEIVKIIVVVRPGSAKRSIKMRPCSFVRALWCSKVPPDTFLDDYRSDFEWIWHVFQNVFAALPLPKNL